jgi:predicted nucleic acid-binding protein
MSYLLDTNVVSELRRRRPDPSVVAWMRDAPTAELFLSVLTVGELRRGVEGLRRRDGYTAHTLDEWLAGLLTVYSERIVPVDQAIADLWGRLNVPDQLPAVDGLLAATAMVRGWILVTRNVADVERTGVQLLNPFTPV